MAENLVPWRSLPTMSRSSNRSLGVGHSPWYQVQRAQILLAVAAGEPIRTLAIRTQCDPSTVWRICRRYEDAGLARSPGTTPTGRATGPDFPPCNVPRSFNWPAWSPSPRACTSPTGPARIWPAKRSQTGSSRPSAIGRSSDPQSGGPPAASHAVLEDVSHRHPVQGAGREGPLVLRQRRAVGPAGLLGGLRR